jgi:hypothetical protein
MDRMVQRLRHVIDECHGVRQRGMPGDAASPCQMEWTQNSPLIPDGAEYVYRHAPGLFARCLEHPHERPLDLALAPGLRQELDKHV